MAALVAACEGAIQVRTAVPSDANFVPALAAEEDLKEAKAKIVVLAREYAPMATQYPSTLRPIALPVREFRLDRIGI